MSSVANNAFYMWASKWFSECSIQSTSCFDGPQMNIIFINDKHRPVWCNLHLFIGLATSQMLGNNCSSEDASEYRECPGECEIVCSALHIRHRSTSIVTGYRHKDFSSFRVKDTDLSPPFPTRPELENRLLGIGFVSPRENWRRVKMTKMSPNAVFKNVWNYKPMPLIHLYDEAFRNYSLISLVYLSCIFVTVSWVGVRMACCSDSRWYLCVSSPDTWSCVTSSATTIFASWPHWGLSNAIMQTTFNY
jgi:hypothetical protein